MKVLFISREKSNGLISPVIQAQADSISGLVELSVFRLKGKGWKSYIKGISAIRKYLKTNKADIIHAHYSYVGMTVSLASKKPLIVSLMGSDIEDYHLGRILIRLFTWCRWDTIIVKSQRSKDRIKIIKAKVIPNGVNFEIFQPMLKTEARRKLGLDDQMKYVLFLSDPERKEKNFELAAESCRLVTETMELELLTLHDVPHSEIPVYLSAVDILLLTSYFEGSPNVIKEAMACNCPIVSTDTGDVKGVIGDTEGCYLTGFHPEDVAQKLKLAFKFGKRTNGRKQIRYLDEKVFAGKLIGLYKSVLKE